MAKRKVRQFGSFEDLISIGALLRPTIDQAINQLSKTEQLNLKAVFLTIEEQLANSKSPVKTRLIQVVENMKNTFKYGPTWRFVNTKMEEIIRSVPQPGMKESNSICLILGMVIENIDDKKDEKKDRAA